MHHEARAIQTTCSSPGTFPPQITSAEPDTNKKKTHLEPEISRSSCWVTIAVVKQSVAEGGWGGCCTHTHGVMIKKPACLSRLSTMCTFEAVAETCRLLGNIRRAAASDEQTLRAIMVQQPHVCMCTLNKRKLATVQNYQQTTVRTQEQTQMCTLVHPHVHSSTRTHSCKHARTHMHSQRLPSKRYWSRVRG